MSIDYRIYDFTGDGEEGDGSVPPVGPTPDVQQLIQEKTKAHQAVVEGLQAEIKALSEKSNMTTKDRQELEQRVTELNNKLLTKEELTKQERERLTKSHAEERERLARDAELWQKRYEETRIVSSLTDAAVKHAAYNPKQLVTLLRNNARISEAEEGSGNFDVRIQLDSTNEKGESVVLDLNAEEAIKHLSSKDDYANLFKSNSTDGFGGRRSTNGGKLDAAVLATDPAAYRAARKAGKV